MPTLSNPIPAHAILSRMTGSRDFITYGLLQACYALRGRCQLKELAVGRRSRYIMLRNYNLVDRYMIERA